MVKCIAKGESGSKLHDGSSISICSSEQHKVTMPQQAFNHSPASYLLSKIGQSSVMKSKYRSNQAKVNSITLMGKIMFLCHFSLGIDKNFTADFLHD